MILLVLLLAAIVFLLSLLGYKKIRDKRNGKPIEWMLWVVFTVWTLGFVLICMSFIAESFPESNRAIAVFPVVLGFTAFIFINRKNI